MKKPGIGIIGCGNISDIYLKNLTGLFDFVEVRACADLDLDCARRRAAEYHVPRACSVGELLSDDSIDLVVNLTVPLAHAEVSLSVLQAGKHVYSEKPLAVNRRDGLKIVQEASDQGRHMEIGSSCDRPSPMPDDLSAGEAD